MKGTEGMISSEVFAKKESPEPCSEVSLSRNEFVDFRDSEWNEGAGFLRNPRVLKSLRSGIAFRWFQMNQLKEQVLRIFVKVTIREPPTRGHYSLA